MVDISDSFRPATPEDITETLAFALRHRRQVRVCDVPRASKFAFMTPSANLGDKAVRRWRQAER
jgi:hypothetical protein